MIKKILLVGIAMMSLAGAAQANIVNIDATSATGTTLSFGAGTYQISVIGTANGGLYNAFDQFGVVANGGLVIPVAPAVSGCNSSGAVCGRGFSDYFALSVSGGTPTLYSLTGLNDPNTGGRFSTELGALAAFQAGPVIETIGSTIVSASSSLRFTLAAPASVTFSIPDTLFLDNTGGVSLSVAAVPEPGTWAMMFVGFGLVAAAARHRRRKTAAAIA